MRRGPRDEPWEGGGHVPWRLDKTILGKTVQQPRKSQEAWLSLERARVCTEWFGVLQERSPRAETSAPVLRDGMAGSLGELCQAQVSSMTLLLGNIPNCLYCYLVLEIHNGESLMF